MSRRHAWCRPRAVSKGRISLDSIGLRSGRLPQFDPRTQRLIVTRINGYMYREHANALPIGFGVFRDFHGEGKELWLAGTFANFQGHGLGRAMLAELLATPPGVVTQLVRCVRHASGARRCSHVLKTLGFATCRFANDEEWLLQGRTPMPVVALIKGSTLEPMRSALARRVSK
jgi:hypothetical protein